MRNTKAKIYALFIVITVVVACVSRFFLFSETLNDSAHSSNILLYSVYLFMVLSAVFSALYASCAKKNAKTFDFEQAPKGIYITSLALSITFFYDFLHQGYNCYKYLTEADYTDYTYLVPVLIGCVSALVCCFYYITVAATAKNTNYDFRNFTLLHFVPLVWALSKLFLIMFKIVDITENIDFEAPLKNNLLEVLNNKEEYSYTFKGKEKIDEINCLKISLTNNENSNYTYYIDENAGYIVQYENENSKETYKYNINSVTDEQLKMFNLDDYSEYSLIEGIN